MWHDQYFANRYVLNRIEYTELFLFLYLDLDSY